MGDAGFGFPLDKVEDGDAGRFAAGAGRGGDGNQRLERAGDGQAAADGGVDVVEEFGRPGGIEVGGLGGVDRAAAADGDVGIKIAALREVDRFVKALVGRLDLDGVEGLVIDF